MLTHKFQCRLCNSDDLTKVISLTATPPANAFVKRISQKLRTYVVHEIIWLDITVNYSFGVKPEK